MSNLSKPAPAGSEVPAPSTDRRTIIGGIAALAAGAGLLAAPGRARAAGDEARSAANLAAVAAIYESFGKGDIPAILARLRADVEWEFGYGQNGDVPWLRAGTGRETAAAFFDAIRAFDIAHFSVTTINPGPEWTLAVISIDFVYRPTGRRVVEPSEVHIWRLDEAGMVKGFRHVVDTRQHAQALQPLPDHAKA